MSTGTWLNKPAQWSAILNFHFSDFIVAILRLIELVRLFSSKPRKKLFLAFLLSPAVLLSVSFQSLLASPLKSCSNENTSSAVGMGLIASLTLDFRSIFAIMEFLCWWLFRPSRRRCYWAFRVNPFSLRRPGMNFSSASSEIRDFLFNYRRLPLPETSQPRVFKATEIEQLADNNFILLERSAALILHANLAWGRFPRDLGNDGGGGRKFMVARRCLLYSDDEGNAVKNNGILMPRWYNAEPNNDVIISAFPRDAFEFIISTRSRHAAGSSHVRNPLWLIPLRHEAGTCETLLTADTIIRLIVRNRANTLLPVRSTVYSKRFNRKALR